MTDNISWPELPGVTHRFLQTPRLRFHVAEAGAGEPIVLLHGWLQHFYAWREVIPELANNYRVICPDLRGCGWTEAPRRGYHGRDLTADVLGLLDAMRLDRVHIVGHDRGADIGFNLALRHPDRVRRLVAINAMHPWPVRRLVAPEAWRFWWTPAVETPLLGRFAIGRVPGFARWLLRHGTRSRRTSAVERAFLDVVRQPARARAAEQMMYQFAYHEMLATIGGANRSMRLTVPTLMLVGGRDQSARSLGGYEPYADQLEIRMIAGAGHALPEERPALVGGAVREFLADAIDEARDKVPGLR
jgi:pimeloyl-ACP methyl ester carboxylesterase